MVASWFTYILLTILKIAVFIKSSARVVIPFAEGVLHIAEAVAVAPLQLHACRDSSSVNTFTSSAAYHY